MSVPMLPEPDVLCTLKRAMEAEQPRVVVVVGAGVSFGATDAAHAKWDGLLRHGLCHLRDSGRIQPGYCKELLSDLEKAFSPFDLHKALEHAEVIQRLLTLSTTKAFDAWLESAFGAFKAQPGRTDTLDALLALQRAGALLLTTNYDSLLADLTGLPPVTRTNREAFLQVVNRKADGILHIHGHWRKPDSVVLGVRSYDDIVADPLFQDAFKSLWIQNHWVYVGCGNGLEDPNLGRLLEWGKQWGVGALEHCYLSIQKEVDAVRGHPQTPINLTCVGVADFTKIAPALRGLTPAARCAPFARIEADCALVRPAHSSHAINPFPSWQEYLDGDVPALQADEAVRNRLQTHGWAFVLDVASVGKTTLAMRMATGADQRDHPSFHLDLADTGPDDNYDARALEAARRIARPGTLLIIDNAHYAPALVRRLWTQWRDRPLGSRLLLIATEAERMVITDPAQDLGFFRMHPSNPALALEPQPEDMKRILYSILRRFSSYCSSATMQHPPAEAVDQWYSDYGHALGAFCIAVLGCRVRLQAGEWSLPYEAAAEWVREKWLEPLNEGNRANALCLAAFGAQELEISVDPAALPQPSKMGQLLSLGLVTKSTHGTQQQIHCYRLREPSWGRLLLTSHHAHEGSGQDVEIFSETLLIEAAARHLNTASLLSLRWRRLGATDSAISMWKYLADLPGYVTAERLPSSLTTLHVFLNEAWLSDQRSLVDDIWATLKHAPPAFITRALSTQLDQVVHFLKLAQRQGGAVVYDELWQALETAPEKLAMAAFATPLGKVAHFLEVAREHKGAVVYDQLWQGLEAAPNRLVEVAFTTSLEHVARFLEVAKKREGTVVYDHLWLALEAAPSRLLEATFATALEHVAHFLEIAKLYEKMTLCELLWSALEADSVRLATAAFETSLEHIARFLKIAGQHQRATVCDQLWDALEKNIDALAQKVQACEMRRVAFFLHVVQFHGRDMPPVLKATPDFGAEPPATPLALTYRIMERIPVGHWAEGGHGRQTAMPRAVTVAMHCRRVGQHQHAQAILSVVIERTDPNDFPPEQSGFSEVALLLKYALELTEPQLFKLIGALCTNRWLHGQYSKAKLGVLAGGLRLLALYQPIRIVRRFCNVDLRLRLDREFSAFSRHTPEQQSQCLQLLGCSVLCGQPVDDSLLRHTVDEMLTALPERILPHREDASHVEEWQYQLWLGLRTVVALKKRPLQVAPEVVQQTRDLWRSNLEYSATVPSSAEHRVDAQMVAWLDTCLRRGECGLIPPDGLLLLPEMDALKPS